LRGFSHWFTFITRCPPCLPRPRHPIVLARRVVVRAACRPSPQLRGQAAPSFSGLPRSARRWGLAPHANRQRLVAHERVQADDRVRAARGDRVGDPVGVVTGHELDLLAAVFAEQIQQLLDRFAVAAGVRPHRPVWWSTTTVRYLWPFLCEISSSPIRASPASRSRWAVWWALTGSRIQPTVRHAIRIS